MSRGHRIGLLLVVLGVAILVVLVLNEARGATRTPPQEPGPVRSFDLPEPSPTPIVGLHDYAAPLRAVPTPVPTPLPQRPKAAPTTAHTSSGSGARTIRGGDLRGWATWYATGPGGLTAAAGPALRKAIGPGWRGSRVLVARAGSLRGIEVRLVDWCACGPRHGEPTILDLSDEAFDALGRLSSGVMRVVVDVP